MVPEAARAYLHDISKACGLIQEFLRGKTYQDYVESPLQCSCAPASPQLGTWRSCGGIGRGCFGGGELATIASGRRTERRSQH